MPYAQTVQQRYAGWLAKQEQAGATFTDSSAGGSTASPTSSPSSAGITADDLDNAPFTERGGVDGAVRDLGDRAAAYSSSSTGAHRVSLPDGWREVTPPRRVAENILWGR